MSSDMLPTATVTDSARAVRDALLPLVAEGAILRRPRALVLAERFDLESRALKVVRRFRQRYGDGPVLLRIPGRTIALVIDPADVRRLLAETPEPFTAATDEKVGALRHFQPHAVLTSDPPIRAARRELNEQALDSSQPVHRNGQRMLDILRAELATLEPMDWPAFREIWYRIARRIVLGDAARDDTILTDQLDQLRSDANWAQLHWRADRTRKRFSDRLRAYVGSAPPTSLAGGLRAADKDLDPAGQVPHWLFAFDAAGIALWRALAVLAARPELAAPVIEEARAPQPSPLLPQASAAINESVRLWPTTLVILRQNTRPVEFRGRTAPVGTEFAIISSVFHRDDEALDFANSFEPAIWLDGRSDGDWPLVPFSAGPAVCPGRNVVLLTTSAAISLILAGHDLRADAATEAKLSGSMPVTLDHSAIELTFPALRTT
ncbi:cytochrome P450 [Kribbella deserti]|uniref:Cytochrome P450 n=1 Tax=Kribbella deserti TaxID=1926257 RepID=A0ABV6QJ13_9ACTN